MDDEGMIGTGMGIDGFVPLFGDLAKFPKQLKRVDDAVEAANATRKAVKPDLSDPQSFRGATAGDVEKALDGLERAPAPHSTGGGFRVLIPGGMAIVEAGDDAMNDVTHRAPYIKFQIGKKVESIPLAGNPAIDD